MRKLILALAGLVAAYVFAGMLAHQRVVPPTELLRYSEADIPQAELLAASGGMAQQEGTLHTQMDGAYLDVTGIAAKVGPLASLTVQVDVSNAAALSQPTRFKVYYAAPGEDFSERRTLVQPLQSGENTLHFKDYHNVDRLRIVPADTAGLAFSVQAVTLNKGYGFSPVWFGLVLAFWAVLLANDAHCRRKARPKGGRLVRLPSESDTRPRRA